MKRNVKIVLIVSLTLLFVLIVISVALYVYADKAITKTVNVVLQEKISQLEGQTASYESVKVSIMSGHIHIKNVYFRSDTAELQGDKNGVETSLKELELTGIRFRKMIKTKHLDIDRLILFEPHGNIFIGGDEKPKTKPIADTISTDTIVPNFSIQSVLRQAGIRQIEIKNASVNLRNISNHLSLNANGLSVTLYDAKYCLADSAIHYNDSLYYFDLQHLQLTLPNGLYSCQFDNLHTENCGPISMHNLHAFNTVKKNQLADKKGKQPATWTDITLSTIETSPVSLFNVVKNKKIEIDKILVQGDAVNLYRDNRYDSKKSFSMPQEALSKIKLPLLINSINLSLKQLNVQVAMKTERVGTIQMTNVQGNISNLTNQSNKTIKTKFNLEIEPTCNAQLALDLKLNKNCQFDCSAKVDNLSCNSFDNFLRPLFGVTAQCDIQSINTSFSGDRNAAKGKFLMIYDNLKVRAYSGESPFEALNKNAGLLNNLGGAIIQQSNPKGNKPPQEVSISYQRNDKKNFAAYIIGTVLEGVKQTVLPNFVVKKINQKSAAKQNPQNNTNTKTKKKQK